MARQKCTFKWQGNSELLDEKTKTFNCKTKLCVYMARQKRKLKVQDI